MTKIQVPEGMLKAALPYCDNQMHSALEAALQWLDLQIRAMQNSTSDKTWFAALEGVRRMFLAEPEIPDPIEDLLLADHSTVIVDQVCERFNSAVREAYRRGARERWATEN